MPTHPSPNCSYTTIIVNNKTYEYVIAIVYTWMTITTYVDVRCPDASDMGIIPSIEIIIMVMSSVLTSYCSQRLYASYGIVAVYMHAYT